MYITQFFICTKFLIGFVKTKRNDNSLSKIAVSLLAEKWGFEPQIRL